MENVSDEPTLLAEDSADYEESDSHEVYVHANRFHKF